MIYIVTDTHINHDRIIELDNRPSNHEELFIESLSKLQWCDTLIHLGDVIFKRAGELSEIMKKIPCPVHLMKGNHDKSNSDSWFLNKGFHTIQYTKELYYHGTKIILSHKPIDMNDRDGFNIHGHWHNSDHNNDFNKKESPFYSNNYNFCLNPEEYNFSIVPLKIFIQDKNIPIL